MNILVLGATGFVGKYFSSHTKNKYIVKTSSKVKKGYKRQWRWRVAHRDALYVAKIIWPYAQVKLHKLEQIIDHYEPRAQELGDNVVDLEHYKTWIKK